MSEPTLIVPHSTRRFLLVAFIAIAMLVPLSLVRGVSDERQSYYRSALTEVATAWGGAQSLAGPFLVVPEEYAVSQEVGGGAAAQTTVVRERVYLPKSVVLNLDVRHQFRERAIYQVPVYTSNLRFSGTFAAPQTGGAEEGLIRVLPHRARLVVGIRETKAIMDAGALTFGDAVARFEGMPTEAWLGGGIQARVQLPEGVQGVAFDFELTVKGSQHLAFLPVAAATRAEASSSWPHPSFDGEYLPESYEIRDDGFDAQWQVHELARSLPDSFMADEQPTPVSVTADSASIRLFQPLTEYRLVDRATKYGLLFIALTFLGFVCFELTLALKFHPVQYGVVGVALVLFYLALLSLSEHVPFGVAYLLATALLTTLVGWYVWAMTRSRRTTAWTVAIIGALYGTLYVLLRLEAFALLTGTAVLFLGLAALMFSTRRMSGEPVAAV
ncbi:MAG TPA: cell envelope integrity protein CreD [Pseudomonadales bacterium]